MYKNRQHPTDVECRLFCCPILLGRCRFCSFLKLLSYRHTPKALFFALLLNSRRKSERFHFGTLLLNFLRKFNHFRTSLPASPTSPDILSGKSHIPSEMPGKKRNNPEIQTPGRRSWSYRRCGWRFCRHQAFFSEYTDVRKSPSHPWTHGKYDICSHERCAKARSDQGFLLNFISNFRLSA